MKTNRQIIIAVAGIMAFAACNPEPETPKVDTTFDSAELTVSKPATAGSGYSINVSAASAVKWTATVEEGDSWISLTTSSGQGNGKVKYDLDENTLVQSRQGKIVITASCDEVQSFSAQKVVKVKQLGTEPYLTIQPDGEVSEKHDAVTAYNVTVSSNMAWGATLEAEGSWISISSGLSGTGDGKVVLSWTENKDSVARIAVLRVASSTSPQYYDSLVVKQQFKGVKYRICFDSMKDRIPEGKCDMTISNGTQTVVPVEVIQESEGTVVEFEQVLDQGNWNISKIGSVTLDADITVGTGGVVTYVETWYQAFGQFGGDTEQRPVRISSEEGLEALAAYVQDSVLFSGKYILQTADITLTKAWNGIGAPNRKFAGCYDGGGYSISGFTMTVSDLSASDENRGHGFFNHVKGRSTGIAAVKNLTINGTTDGIKANFGGVATIAAHIADSVLIENCVSNVDITACTSFSANGGSFVGGIVGWANGACIVVRGCVNNGSVNTSSCNVLANNNGGVIGSIEGAEASPAIVQGCTNNGSISIRGNGGGVVGNVSNHVQLSRLANKGNLTNSGATTRAGGVVGSMSNATSKLSESFNKASIISLVNTGGVVGFIETGATVENCYNRGSIQVTGNNPNNGGVVGHKKDSKSVVKNCYCSASMSGTDSRTNFGGVVGSNLQNAPDILTNISGCCYESGLGAVKAIAKNQDNTVDESVAVSRTLPQMTSGAAFTGWDVAVWSFEAGSYPQLANNPEQ